LVRPSHWRWPSSSMYAVTWIELTAAIEGTPWASSWAQISGPLEQFGVARSQMF
jgi:hypothetical protein